MIFFFFKCLSHWKRKFSLETLKLVWVQCDMSRVLFRLNHHLEDLIFPITSFYYCSFLASTVWVLLFIQLLSIRFTSLILNFMDDIVKYRDGKKNVIKLCHMKFPHQNCYSWQPHHSTTINSVINSSIEYFDRKLWLTINLFLKGTILWVKKLKVGTSPT